MSATTNKAETMTNTKANRSDMAHNGLHTKEARYGWQMQDEPGQLCMVHKSQLQVDHTYQRDSHNPKVNRIAQDWSWVACGAIIVADRGDGLFVIDGQHRVLAAQKRTSITTLPCLVFRTDSVRQEAKGFLTTQTQRRPVTSVDKHRAATVIGDRAHAVVAELAEAAGRTIAGYTSPTSIRCVGIMVKMVERDEVRMRRIWPLIVELSVGKPIHERMVEGLLYIEQHMPGDESLMDREWRRRVLKAGHESLMDHAAKACALFAKGGAKVWATGMVQAINRGHRNLLAIRDAE